MKATILLLLTLLARLAFSQVNLVENPGFESWSQCPTGYTTDLLTFSVTVPGWICPTNGTSDYFSACANVSSPIVGVPQNVRGYRAAHSGTAYTGIFVSRYIGAMRDYCEYLQGRLTQPLRAGEYYCVSFYVSVPTASDMNFTTDAIGAFFTNDTFTRYTNGLYFDWKLPGQWAITNPAGNYILPQDGWVKISGIYRAKGNERYITIGNTAPPDSTPLQTIQTNAAENAAYFYVDDVSVVKISNAQNDTVVCSNNLPVFQLVSDSSVAGYLWSTGDTTRAITPGAGGLYWVEYEAGCEAVIRDTVRVSAVDAPQFTLPADTFLCAGNTLQISATAVTGSGTGNYMWNTGSTSSSIVVDRAGEYILQAGNLCGAFADSITIDLRDKPEVLMPAEVNLCMGGELTPLTVTSSLPLNNYNWSTGETTGAITISQPGQYWLSSQNECGTTRRYFDAEGCPLPFASIFIPNAFSPNGDGNNDVWAMYSYSIRINSIAVFNRWGEKVFETDTNTGWDGTYKGVLQTAGVYAYYIKCSDLLTTEPRHYKGTVTLLR